MSKLIKLVATVALIVAVSSAAAEARGGHWHGGYGGHWHGGWHGGGWYGGGWGWGLGIGPYWGGYPYSYYPYYAQSYYYDSSCGWVRVHVRRNGHWVWRRAWRCW